MKNQKEIDLTNQIKYLERQLKVENKKYESFCNKHDKLHDKIDKDYIKAQCLINDKFIKAEEPILDLQQKISELKFKLKNKFQTEYAKEIKEAIALLEKCGYTVLSHVE